jgi:chemotaxis protein MotB
MASKATAPEPIAPIIVKKIIVAGHGGHHGGAWKVAYADFVTAMMAFFLLMWLLGATTEKQRKALADYFTPTLVETKQASAGSNGPFGGDSLMAKDNYPTKAGQSGKPSIAVPRDMTGTAEVGGKDMKNRDKANFEDAKQRIKARLARRKDLARLLKNVRFTDTREGLRIDLVDEADFAMFLLGGDQLTAQAQALLIEVAGVAADLPNDLIIRGHTDALPYANGKSMNNWLLSAARAEATRIALLAGGIGQGRFARIEGVADREPFNPSDRYDPRNRRMSITLAWSKSAPDIN